MITALVISALAAVWGWMVLNLPNPPRPIRWIRDGLRALPRGEGLTACPWCIGAWLAILSTVALHWSMGLLDWIGTPLGALAAAGLTGVIGSSLDTDDGEPN